ncbi:MAG: SPOR domain-containing protein [Flavobacterium sp.]|nr:MAG: SPOR domain-containing protein [Flavobacterium sp.]
MKIEQYISQLLYRYQCVTVPGFGAFLTETQPAHLHESSNAFYPPKKLISFNSYLKNNDGLLANHIATLERTSYEAAVESIQSEVGIWKNILEINQKFTLKNIGELSLNSEKNVVFSPYEQLNYLTDAFGLSSFVSPVVKRENYKKEVAAIEEKAPIVFSPEKRAGKSYLKYTAIIVLALGVAGTIGFKMYQDQVESQTLAVQKQVQKEVQNKIQEATFFIENPMPAVTLSVADENMPYHVVAGAFREEANAERAFEDLSKKGYKAKKLPANRHGLYPVIYGSYPSYKEAWQAMSQIQKTDNPDAWVLIKDF